MSTATKPCQECSVEVTRELPDGKDRISQMLRGLPFWCDRCEAAAGAEREAQERREAAERERRQASIRVQRSGLPGRHHRVGLGELDHPADVIGALRRWAWAGGGLLLTGAVGRGKTTLAGAAAWERLQHKSLVWTSVPLLLAALGSGFGSEQRQHALELLSGATALVLDDIDKARPTEFGAEQVFLAVDQRVEHEKPLLVTTNLAPSQLAERWPDPYGHAIASRLVGYCRVLRIEGVDRRLRRTA